MQMSVTASKGNQNTPSKSELNQFASVEISAFDVNFCYHFKLWNMASANMCILVKENSEILSQLKEGSTLNMKYYAGNALSHAENRKTAIRHVTKDDHGRFKGHYLVQLEILDQKDQENSH